MVELNEELSEQLKEQQSKEQGEDIRFIGEKVGDHVHYNSYGYNT